MHPKSKNPDGKALALRDDPGVPQQDAKAYTPRGHQMSAFHPKLIPGQYSLGHKAGRWVDPLSTHLVAAENPSPIGE